MIAQSGSKTNIHSETYFIIRLIKFVLTMPFLLPLCLFSKAARASLKSQARNLKGFFSEAKWTNRLILLNIIIFIIEIALLIYQTSNGTLDFISEYVLKYESTLVFPHTIFANLLSWFLHAGVLHLLFNMITLFIFGRIVEKEYGNKIILIYFGSAICSSILSTIMGEYGIGASGAIAGLIATAILTRPFYFTYLFVIPIPVIIVGWLTIFGDITGILYKVSDDNIGHFAHLGGYLAIMLFTFFASYSEREKLKKGLIINIILVAIAILVKIYFFGKLF